MNSRFALALVAALSMLVGIPSAAAQQLSADPENTNKSVPPLKPEIDEATIELAYVYSFQQVAFPAAGLTKTTLTATLEDSCADATNIILTGPRSQSVDINPTNDATGTQTTEFLFQLQVSVTRQLQGLKRIQCETSVSVDAVSADGTAIPESNEVTDTFTVTASYYGLIQSKVTGQIKKTGPQKEISFPITLDNYGNARTRVQFEILERPGGKKWQAVVPDDVILDSPYDGGPKTSDTAKDRKSVV